MKKKLLAVMIWMLAVCIIIPAGLAEEGSEEAAPVVHEHAWSLSKAQSTPATCTSSGLNVYICSGCSETKTETVPLLEHSWGEWDVTKEATCAESGSQTRTCTVCGKQETKSIPKTGDHKWGEWTVSREASCLGSGIHSHTCEVCGKTATETIPRREHKWSEWTVKNEPTCTKRGTKRRNCSLCGATEDQRIEKLGHDVPEWTVTKEPTCRKTGTKTGVCTRCGEELTKELSKTDHRYEEWEILEEATDFSKGKHRSACVFCNREKTEDFYPEGTLGRKLENDPDTVMALQSALTDLKLYKGSISGEYDKATENAVTKAEKGLGLKADGIGWPGVLKLLGVKETTGKEITRDSSKYLLRLEVQQTSRRKDVYFAGDELKFGWVLTNSAKKSSCTKTKTYEFDIRKAVRQKDVLLENIGTLKAGESVSGTFVYQVTVEDAAFGRFSLGFTAKGSIGGNTASSNTVMFVNTAGSGQSDQETAGEDSDND